MGSVSIMNEEALLELSAYLTERLGDKIEAAALSYGELSLTVAIDQRC